MIHDLCAGLDLRECFSCKRWVENVKPRGKHYGWIHPQTHNGRCIDYVERLRPPPDRVEDKL